MDVEVTATDGSARTTTVRTPRGTYTTPAFMPVGTRGVVRTLSSADLDDLGLQVILANTYHLMLRPGVDVVAALGGLHRFEAWNGHILTDSGGFQIFSLDPAVDDDGVVFRSVYDGSRHRLTPERATEIQEQLGADIAMVLDVCPGLPAEPDVIRTAVTRTREWAARCRDAHHRRDQALFGIVQGGTDPDLRQAAARDIVGLGFDGYAVGGLSVGESRAEMLPALDAALSELPWGRTRYLMGVGDPVAIVEAVALGVDQFDCVLPTRLARHGTVLTAAGRLSLRRAENAADDSPLDPCCACSVCRRWSRAYLRHLLVVGEPAGGRLLTLHNLAWMVSFMDAIRAAISGGSLAALRDEVRAGWDTSVG